MYVLMLAIPFVGYLGASFSKSGVRWFGLSTPRWASPDHDLAERLFDLHGALVWVLVALVVLHALGALRHLRTGRGDIVRRMWFKSTS
jgi:cytochrome b561